MINKNLFKKIISLFGVLFFTFLTIAPTVIQAASFTLNVPVGGYVVGDTLTVTANGAPDDSYLCFEFLGTGGWVDCGDSKSNKVKNGYAVLASTHKLTRLNVSDNAGIDIFFSITNNSGNQHQDRDGAPDKTFVVKAAGSTTGGTGTGSGNNSDPDPATPLPDDNTDPSSSGGSGGSVSGGGSPLEQGLGAIRSQFPTTGRLTNPNQSIVEFIKSIINLLLIVAMAVDVLFIIIGGFQYITSAGNEEMATKGRKTLLNALIGLSIIIMSFVIVSVVNRTLTRS